MAENKRNPDEVVVIISGDEDNSKNKISLDSPLASQNSTSTSITKLHPKIPTNETLTRRKSLARSVYSKPKSRFGEQSLAIDGSLFDELAEQQTTPSPDGNNASSSAKVMSPNGKSLKETTTTTPLMASPGGVDEHEEIYKKVNTRNKMKYKKVKLEVFVEWLMFCLLLGCLIASLLVHKLQRLTMWDLEIWKWIVLVMVTFSGMLVTKWFIHFIVLLIELNFLLRKKVLYFVFGLKKSVQVTIWLSLVLLTWVLLFANGVKRSQITNKIINYITWTIASLLIGAFLWLFKTFMLKVLASSFHANTFFDRIQRAIFHQYILLTLSGPPIMDSTQMLGRSNSSASQLSLCRTKKGKDGKAKKEKKEKIDINKLHQMKREKVSAWTMKTLIDVISNSGLSTISGSIGDTDYDRDNEQADKEINNEEEAIAAAVHIFKNVAQPGSKFIDEYDLRRFMIKEEVDIVLPLIDVADTGQIDRKALTEWVCIFEGIVFVFVMHPFDVGDRCVVDGIQMTVEEMNILTTVFLKFDNEKLYFPNSVLATKPISNFYRSPDMSDSFEFSIDFRTRLEKIGSLKEKIKKYLERTSQYWHPNHNVVVKDIENLNKIKMVLLFNHTMNFQNFGEKIRRRTELILEMKKMFEELNIKYDLLTQEVHLIESK
uniref:Mechanosensitive ion channel domain-containing protein n=1 Tax=Solanum tuberosum TaxID=4113 RepID=M1CXG5_SOLTU